MSDEKLLDSLVRMLQEKEADLEYQRKQRERLADVLGLPSGVGPRTEGKVIAVAIRRIEELEERNERAVDREKFSSVRKALQAYGVHLRSCASLHEPESPYSPPYDCNCGLEAMLVDEEGLYE